MALFTVEVVNGMGFHNTAQHRKELNSVAADLLESAAAKVFWDQDLPLPMGSTKRVSGAVASF